MKEFKGLKVPEIILPETQEDCCDIIVEAYSCGSYCSDCIYDGRNFDAFNEWKLSNKDKDAK